MPVARLPRQRQPTGRPPRPPSPCPRARLSAANPVRRAQRRNEAPPFDRAPGKGRGRPRDRPLPRPGRARGTATGPPPRASSPARPEQAPPLRAGPRARTLPFGRARFCRHCPKPPASGSAGAIVASGEANRVLDQAVFLQFQSVTPTCQRPGGTTFCYGVDPIRGANTVFPRFFRLGPVSARHSLEKASGPPLPAASAILDHSCRSVPALGYISRTSPTIILQSAPGPKKKPPGGGWIGR